MNASTYLGAQVIDLSEAVALWCKATHLHRQWHGLTVAVNLPSFGPV